MKGNINYAENAIKKKIESIQRDYKSLEAVDHLLGKGVTEAKKLELLNIIFALQDVRQEIIDEMCKISLYDALGEIG